MYMQDKNVLNDKEGIEVPAVHAMATSTEHGHDRHSITVNYFIHEQTKDSDCSQASVTAEWPESAFG